MSGLSVRGGNTISCCDVPCFHYCLLDNVRLVA